MEGGRERERDREKLHIILSGVELSQSISQNKYSNFYTVYKHYLLSSDTFHPMDLLTCFATLVL
jgi:hypothetical protein